MVTTAPAEQPQPPKLVAALQRAQARIHALEQENGTLRQENNTLCQENGALRQEIKWRDQLDAVPATVMSQNQKAALKVTLQAIQHKTPDTDGLVQIESWHLCKKAGMSKGTFLDHLAYCTELGILRKHTEQVRDPDSQQVIATNYFVGTTELTAHPYKYQAPQPRNHGGARPRCKNPACRSERLQKRTIKRTIITCLDCGEVQSDETDDQTVMPSDHLDQQFDHAAESSIVESTLEPQSEPDMSSRNVDSPAYKTNVLESQLDVLAPLPQEPVSPPVSRSGDDPGQQEDRANQLDLVELMQRAAALLVEIAGTEPVHIEMSARGPAKYYEVKRPFSLQDARDHLAGKKTKGATLRRPDSLTRALCYDADTNDDWYRLLEAAHFLASAGYTPLVEDSPAGRGGHLWVIYSDLVNAWAAHRHVCELAPQLQAIKECWPGKSNHKVRLPGGLYVKPGFSQQCKLYDAIGARLSDTRRDAARTLLTYQTPAAIVPEYPPDPEPGQCSTTCQLPSDKAPSSDQVPAPHVEEREAANDQREAFPYKLPEVDVQWIAKYGPVETTPLWFAITDAYAAAWFNEHNSLESIRPRERNGMALSPNGDERTASTHYRQTLDGERWTDFSAHGCRPDGTHESGDALELACKVWRMSKAAILSETTREIIRRARAELEKVAAAGRPLPPWFEEPCMITPAGRRRFAELSVVAQGETGKSEQTASLVVVTQPGHDQAEQRDQICKYEQKAPLVRGQRVSTPAGLATVGSVVYLKEAQQWRCSVWTDDKCYTHFDVSEVQIV